MARRLPIYLLLDTSASMCGEAIAAVQNGVQMMISALQNDPQALETVYISIITFDDFVTQLIPLTEVCQFTLPILTAHGCTSTGDALKFVSDCADREVMKKTTVSFGDWKPMVFIMTDGAPTDDFDSGLKVFKAHKWGMVAACAVGAADERSLQSITENVFKLPKDAESIKAFFEWVFLSIKWFFKSDQLPPPPPLGIIIC